MYVDNVIIKGATNDTVLNMDSSIRLAHPTRHAVNIDDFKMGQIGTINIFEKALNVTEIKDLHYLYNVRYLLKNSIINCRISENVDPLNPNFIPRSGDKYKLISSSFRFTINNFTRLHITNADDFVFFDGKSFDVSQDRPTGYTSREFRRLQNRMTGATNTQLAHSFNCWI
jgi:hypothetical protein